MDLEEYSKSSSEETDPSSDQNNDIGTGRSYECIFCKRGFTTAQALGGHMNIHRKDKPNKTRPSFPLSSSNKVDDNNYVDQGFYSEIPTAPDKVDANNYHQVYLPATACRIRPSHVQDSEFFCVENQQEHPFGQEWRHRNLSLYTSPFGEIKDKFEDSEEGGLDLELRLGHHP